MSLQRTIDGWGMFELEDGKLRLILRQADPHSTIERILIDGDTVDIEFDKGATYTITLKVKRSWK
jgi:hypothetical protein